MTRVPAECITMQVGPVALNSSAILRWKFSDDFAHAFRAELASLHCQRWLEEKLDQRMGHSKENVKQFICVISECHNRVIESVTEADKVDRVPRQMQPQLKNLA